MAVAAVTAVGGLRASPLLCLPALAGAVLCLAALYRGAGRAAGRAAARDRGAGAGAEAAGAGDRDDWASFLRLSGAVVCRSIVFVGLSTFVSLYVRQRTGGGATAGTAALCVLYLGGAVGTVAGSRLAARYGRLPVARWSYALTVPAVAGVVTVPAPLLCVCVACVSAILYVPFSLHITLGQDYLPGRVGTASGVTLGLTVSVGGLASPVLGAAADAASLSAALAPLAALPAVGWLLLRGLREPGVAGAFTGKAPPPAAPPAPPAGTAARP